MNLDVLDLLQQGARWAEAHPMYAAGGWAAMMGTGLLLKRLRRQPHPSDEGYGSASLATVREARNAGLFEGDGVVLGEFGRQSNNILRAGGLHVIGVGPSGIGKSTLLICTLRSWMGDALVFDLTGDLIRETIEYRPGKVYIWEPASPISMRLNPYDQARWGHPFETLDVQRVAAHLTMTNTDHTSDIGTYFKDIAELVLTFTPIYLQYQQLNGNWDSRLIQKAPVVVSPESLMRFLRETPSGGLVPLLTKMTQIPHQTIRTGALALLKETPSRREDGWNAAARWLNPWLDPVLAQATATAAENPRTETIPIKDLQQGDEPITIYLRLTPEDAQGRLRNVTRLILEQIMMWVKARDARDYRRELFIAFDDMAELGYLPLVERIASFDRKYGIRLCALLQDFNQLWRHFGQHTSLLTNFGVWVVFRPNDPRNAEFLTGKLGEMTWRESMERVTSSPLKFGMRSQGEIAHARPLMTAEEIQTLDPREVLVFVHPPDAPSLKIQARAIRYYNHPLFRGAA